MLSSYFSLVRIVCIRFFYKSTSIILSKDVYSTFIFFFSPYFYFINLFGPPIHTDENILTMCFGQSVLIKRTCNGYGYDKISRGPQPGVCTKRGGERDSITSVEPDSKVPEGSQNKKRIFMFWRVGCSFCRAEGFFFGSFEFLHRGLKININGSIFYIENLFTVCQIKT